MALLLLLLARVGTRSAGMCSPGRISTLPPFQLGYRCSASKVTKSYDSRGASLGPGRSFFSIFGEEDLNILPALLAALIKSPGPLTTGNDSFLFGIVALAGGVRETDDRGESSRTRVTPLTVGKAALVRARFNGGGRRRGFKIFGVANFPPFRLYDLSLSFFFPVPVTGMKEGDL